MTSPHRVAGRFFSRPLLLAPGAAETISAFLLSRLSNPTAGGGMAGIEHDASDSRQIFPSQINGDGTAEVHAPRASRFHGEYPLSEDGNRRPLPFRRTAGGTAIVTMVGELVNRGAWIGASSGLISYEGLKAQLAAAVRDPRTKSILLDLESPGGEAVGAFEAADAVRQAAKVKPVVAVVNGMAASAAYAIASAANRVVTLQTGVSGSIGVVLMHLDVSEYLKAEGLKPTLIHAGAKKVDGNPFEPLPKSVRADLQAEVDEFYSLFLRTVAAGRPGLTEDAIRSTEAATFMGEQAVRIGLADAVGTFEEVLANLDASKPLPSQTRPSPGRPPASTEATTPRSTNMTDDTQRARAEERTRLNANPEQPRGARPGEPGHEARHDHGPVGRHGRGHSPFLGALVGPRRRMAGRTELNLDADAPPAGAGQASAVQEGADSWDAVIDDLNARAGLKRGANIRPVQGVVAGTNALVPVTR